MALTWRKVARRANPAARAEAEAMVFNQMAVALDRRFPPGGAMPPPKGPVCMAELRHLARGIAVHGGWFPPDPLGLCRAEASITGYQPGDRILLSEASFTRLAGAVFAALTAETAAA